MTKNSFTDLKFVLILAFLSIIFLFNPSLNQYPQIFVSYVLLVLFLPGYSLLAAIKPSVNELPVWKRILFSLGLGVILIVVAYILWIYTPLVTYLTPLIEYLSPLEVYISPLETYATTIFILSIILIVDMVLISWARRRAPISDLSTEPNTQGKKGRYIYCGDCKGYYKLEENESLEDFESCLCGGKLVYAEKQIKENGKVSFVSEEIKQVTQRGSYYLDLHLVLVVSIICLVVLQQANQQNYLTIIEFLLMLFLPGYAFISVIYPRKGDVKALDRVVYSFASSIVITTIVAVVLNYSQYNKLVNPILYALSGLAIVFLFAAYLRRSLIQEEKRFSIDFSGFIRDLGRRFSKEAGTEKLLSLILIISIVSVGFTTYITANPLEEKYTDFYVLGADGNVVNSINMTSYETGNVTISVVNHENRKTTYKVLVISSGNVLFDEDITLEDEEKKDINFNFTVGDPGTREMELILYKLPDVNNVYLNLHVTLNVNENPLLYEENDVIV